ncbi:hypothetical protein N9N67_05705 [Bacteriovoracaceae bacterium]|nr:hypothetical protein [Bacteriovoracaceae bacterium]
MKLFLIFFSISLFSYSQNNERIRVEATFKSDERDSSLFIKSQLLYLAFTKAMTKKMGELNLNSSLFWKKYNEAFGKSFLTVEKRIENKYKKDDVIPKDRYKSYLYEMRVARLSRKSSFGSIKNYIKSYIVKKLSRSSKKPNVRYIVLDTEISMKRVFDFYHQFVFNQNLSHYETLYLEFDFLFPETTPLDMGVNDYSELTEVLSKNWLEWFNNNKPGTIKNVLIMNENIKSKLNEFLNLPKEEKASHSLSNGLTLKVSTTIKKISDINPLKNYQFSISGGLYLKDNYSNRYHVEEDIEIKEKVFRDIDYNAFSSTLANYLYRLYLTNFSQINLEIAKISKSNQIVDLMFFNSKSIKSSLMILDDLKLRGMDIGLDYKLDNVNQNFHNAKVFFNGSFVDLKSLLQSIKGQKSVSFDLVETDSAFTIKFF